MKTLFFILLFCGLGLAAAAQNVMMVTTIESIVPGGAGRSKMLVTDTDGRTTEMPLENLFSLGGINFDNIKSNQAVILKKLNELIAQGWKINNIMSGDTDQIYMTRYILAKQ